MEEKASAMMKETADACRSAFTPDGILTTKTWPELRKLLDRAACDLEAAASIIFHNIQAPIYTADWLTPTLSPEVTISEAAVEAGLYELERYYPDGDDHEAEKRRVVTRIFAAMTRAGNLPSLR